MSMGNLNKVIVVAEHRYRELLRAEALLGLLDESGVDNWEGYEMAMEAKSERLAEVEKVIAATPKEVVK